MGPTGPRSPPPAHRWASGPLPPPTPQPQTGALWGGLFPPSLFHLSVTKFFFKKKSTFPC